MEKINIKDNSNDKKYFTIIPNYILNHSTLYDREVYIQMKRIAGDNGTCWTSQTKLSKQCGISINRLKKSLKYLLEHGWIKFLGYKDIETKGGIQQVCEYSITDLWQLNNDFYKDKGVSPDDTPITKGYHEKSQRGITKNPKGYHQMTTNKNPINNITINKIREDKSSPVKTIYDIFKKYLVNSPKPIKDKKGFDLNIGSLNRLIKKYTIEGLAGMLEQVLAEQSKADKYFKKCFSPLDFEKNLDWYILYFKGQKENKIISI
jgi:hypothetical protein